MKARVNIFWFRRDLRLHDNAGLYHALKSDRPVLPLFIFDRNILDQLENKQDARVEFIYRAILSLQERLVLQKSSLELFYGKPVEIFKSLLRKFDIGSVFTNEDYEPYAHARDIDIEVILQQAGIEFLSFKDQVIFSKDEILKDDGLPYTVFTPYSNKWKKLLAVPETHFLQSYPVEKYDKNFYKQPEKKIPDLISMGFTGSGKKFPGATMGKGFFKNYATARDYPGLDATSRLGIHLRFGTISIRQLAAESTTNYPVFLNELIWRDFYQMICWHFPQVGKGHAFKPAYEKIPWRNNEKEFEAWCEGKTGYPLVDAGMRQLSETGFMHNRVRMVTASFLSKHLLIDWRWGEAWFAEKLLDFDLASNNGGWQWAAGCGCDAAPYFRIFNPSLQQQKFDPDGLYIKRWLADFLSPDYPAPIVDHVFARERAIRVYREGLGS